MSFTPESKETYGRFVKTVSHRPQFHHFSNEVFVPPPTPSEKLHEAPSETADLADDTYFYNQQKPNVIHSKLKNANARDVAFHQSTNGQQRRPPSSGEEYDDGETDDDDDYDNSGAEDPEAKTDEQQGEDDDYGDNPDVKTDYEIVDAPPPPVHPKKNPKRPVRDPTLAVVAGRGKGSRHRRPSPNPCDQQKQRNRKIQTKSSKSYVKTTKKFRKPEQLYAEIAKIIDTKQKNIEKPGHEHIHWELKIVPTQIDDEIKK